MGEGGAAAQPEAEDPNSNELYDDDKPEDSVFTKLIKTLTNQNGYKDDGNDKAMNRLNAAAMASTTAMDTVPEGTIQQYVQGDSVQHFLASRLIIVDANDELRVKGTQQETIKGNTTHLYLSNFLRGVSENDELRVTGERHIVVTGESSEDYGAKHEINAPEEFEWKTKEMGLSVVKIDISGMSLDIHATELDIHQYDIEIAGVKTGGFEGYETFAAQRAAASALLDRIGGSLDALAEINAFPSLGFDLPF